MKWYRKGVKILKATIGLVTNSPSLVEEDKFYLLETDFHKIQEIPYSQDLDGYIYIVDVEGESPRVFKEDKKITAVGDFTHLHLKSKDLRYSLLGNEGLLYRYTLKILEEKYGIFSFHACGLFEENKNLFYIIAGGAGSGKTTFLLKGIEEGFKIFSTEMIHFQIKGEKVVFFKGSLADNIRVGNLKYDYPKAARLLGVKIPEVENEWGTKITVDMSTYQTSFDTLEDPSIVLVFPHVEEKREKVIRSPIKSIRTLTKMIFDNISEKVGESILLYEELPVEGMDNSALLLKRFQAVRDFLEKAKIKGSFTLIAGTENCLQEVKL